MCEKCDKLGRLRMNGLFWFLQNVWYRFQTFIGYSITVHTSGATCSVTSVLINIVNVPNLKLQHITSFIWQFRQDPVEVMVDYYIHSGIMYTARARYKTLSQQWSGAGAMCLLLKQLPEQRGIPSKMPCRHLTAGSRGCAAGHRSGSTVRITSPGLTLKQEGHYVMRAQQTRDIEPLLVQCCSTVYDAGPTLNQ